MKPAAYFRLNRDWHHWLGRTGRVVASTVVRVAQAKHQFFVPYSFVLVDFGTERQSFMGAGHETFKTGDRVRCVWRRIASVEEHQLLPYGIKVSKLTSAKTAAQQGLVDAKNTESSTRRTSE